ncbi:MAG TPA: maleylpyruvate isomerase family mycothiol-dependent enzyme [Acidimicrobiales bacterium]|jgi:uncharacterized protein (TIGR03083 family)
MADARVDALRSSVARLHGLAVDMSDADLTHQAFPTEWTIADVLSHLGSGAVITQRRLEDALVGTDTPDDFAPGVWDTWNAKDAVAKRDDALAADAELLARIDAVTSDERAVFSFSMGPMSLGFDQFVAMRLNEHALHTWDIEIVRDPTAIIPDSVAELVVDNLDLVARFTAKPTGDTISVTVHTSGAERTFAVELTPETVTFGPSTATADVELPAEAFARLVYGRLDPAHTPPGVESTAVALLRRVFPGP